jgi:Shedu protein SduA, C-terminal
VTSDTSGPKPSLKKCEISVRAGQPLQFTDAPGSEAPNALPSSLDTAIGRTLDAYTRAARKLVEGKYASQRDIVPSHMRAASTINIIRCTDGIFVRYDAAPEGEEKIGLFSSDASLADVAPQFSEQLIYFPADPKTYIPSPGGLEIALVITDPKTGAADVPIRLRPLIYGRVAPSGFKMPLPPARPPCLISVSNESDFYLDGILVPSDTTLESAGPEAVQFTVHNRARLPVGWEAIEIYPQLGEDHWKPEYAPIWAELDILAAIAQKNAVTLRLNRLDSRGATRKHYAALLREFETLLDGPEEPMHQFLKQHPELLCPTHERMWSKLPFGNRVSDFVFREPYNDYLLVEIEAPSRELFRKDGQQREELTHAINQIDDWIQFVADNKHKVEEELGLVGISVNPRSLIVIGRSASLTGENRRKINTTEAQRSKLRILTYDDLLASCRAHLERILGPLALGEQSVEIYYYKEGLTPGS